MSNLSEVRKSTHYFKVAFKGFCMGIADVIPGVSGGTIAFILGIYEELILSIKSLDVVFLKLFIKGKWKEAFTHLRWRFLLSLSVGILAAIFTFAKLISLALTHKPVLVYAFFFGLICSSIFIIARLIKTWTPGLLGVTLFATVGMYWIVGLVPVATPEAAWFLFLCGALAICAMILPGISGAFILVLLGKYQFILEAVHERDLMILSVVALGVGFGIISFVRVLHWLFIRWHDFVVVILLGLVGGSLRKIWPWKETLEFTTSSSGKVIPLIQINIWPPQYNAEVMLACGLFALGFFCAIYLNPKQTKILSSA